MQKKGNYDDIILKKISFKKKIVYIVGWYLMNVKRSKVFSFN